MAKKKKSKYNSTANWRGFERQSWSDRVDTRNFFITHYNQRGWEWTDLIRETTTREEDTNKAFERFDKSCDLFSYLNIAHIEDDRRFGDVDSLHLDDLGQSNVGCTSFQFDGQIIWSSASSWDIRNSTPNNNLDKIEGSHENINTFFIIVWQWTIASFSPAFFWRFIGSTAQHGTMKNGKKIFYEIAWSLSPKTTHNNNFYGNLSNIKHSGQHLIIEFVKISVILNGSTSYEPNLCDY